MAEWQQIGSVEVCVGTDGAVGVSFDGDRVCVAKKTMYLGWCNKADFESTHCKPRHRLIESCDGSVCVTGVTDLEPVPFEVEADAPDNATIAREAREELRKCRRSYEFERWAIKWGPVLCQMLGAE